MYLAEGLKPLSRNHPTKSFRLSTVSKWKHTCLLYYVSPQETTLLFLYYSNLNATLISHTGIYRKTSCRTWLVSGVDKVFSHHLRYLLLLTFLELRWTLLNLSSSSSYHLNFLLFPQRILLSPEERRKYFTVGRGVRGKGAQKARKTLQLNEQYYIIIFLGSSGVEWRWDECGWAQASIYGIYRTFWTFFLNGSIHTRDNHFL